MTIDQAGSPPALEVIAVEKWFGANHANRAVSFSVAKGAIHGVIGENGAGKSTIMRIVHGELRRDGGVIRVHGALVDIRRPADAIALGIGMVHQHFTLVDPFTAVENVTLGFEGGAWLAGGAAAARAALKKLGDEFGLTVDLDRPVGELPVGARQRLEILKALHRGADILILDEPTAVLTPDEADRLFDLLRRLRDQGKTIIIITHKLREIMAVTSRVTVMRRGGVVATIDTAATDRGALAAMMVGDVIATATRPASNAPDGVPGAAPGTVALAARGLRVIDDGGVERVRGLDLTVRAGEVVGVAGVSGNGQSELLEALAGMRAIDGGQLTILGRDVTGGGAVWNPRMARRMGVAHVPEDRTRVGMVGDFPAFMASILGYHDDPAINRGWRGWRLVWSAVKRRCLDAMAAFDTRPADADLPSGRFSGGNQQKILLARELGRAPKVLLIGQPTRGVDVGAIAFIHQRILDARAQGAAILLVSVELDEILALADRVVVMFEGRVTGQTTPKATNHRELGLLMAGGGQHA